jgi:hypothetical protein
MNERRAMHAGEKFSGRGAPEIDRAEMAAIDRIDRTKPSRFERRDHVGVRSIVGGTEGKMPSGGIMWWDRRNCRSA